MDKYAEGKVIETATGYIVSIMEPIDVEVTVPEGSTEVTLHAVGGTKWIDINTQYLVTLEVNGVKELYRELWTSGDYDDNNSVSIGNHSYTMDDSYLSDLTEDDVVRIRFEPVEVLTTDAFRAAVKKVAPSNSSDESSGGGSGLPTPTSDDVGKVATVVSETSKGAVIVPEQTVTCDGTNETLMSNTVPSLFTDGQKVLITFTALDGEQSYVYESTVEMEFVSEFVMRPVAKFADNMGKVAYTSDGLALYTGEALTVSVSVNVAETEANWGMASGGGVEFVKFDLGEGLPPTVICDHTKTELDAAREAGKTLIGLFNDEMCVLTQAPEGATAAVPAYTAIFFSVDIGSRAIYRDHFSCDRNGEWSYDEASLEVPAS